MKRLMAAVVIVLGLITLYGFISGDGRDPLRLSVVREKRLITVVVSLPQIAPTYRWLSVYGCSAEMGETGTFCTGDWEMESTRELAGYAQELFPWRDVPRGTMQITAMAFDAERKVLASNQLTVIRGDE